MMTIIRFFFFACILDSQLVFAGLDDAKKAYLADDYETVLREARPLAEEGNAGAQTLLGNLYRNGDGVQQDYEKAISWYMKAYRQGEIVADYWLKQLHIEGYGMFCKPEKFNEITLPLAREGYAPAQVSVCNAYIYGKCKLPKDFVKARGWCERAIEQGYSEAQHTLDVTIPEQEKITNKQLEQVKDYELKATQGDLDAHFKLGMLYSHGDVLGGIGKDNSKASYWFKKPAVSGNLEAQVHLGLISVEQGNLEKAEGWFKMAADKGNPDAQAHLGILLVDKKRTKEGLEWLTKSAEQNNFIAQYSLGMIYENGADDIVQNYITAYMWYWLACTYNENVCDVVPRFSGPQSLAKLMPASDIEKAKNLARDWLKQYGYLTH